MGGGASALADTIDRDVVMTFMGDAFDEAKFNEMAGEGGTISKDQAISFLDSTMKNSALVFIKPHANNEVVRKFVSEKLTAAGCSIVAEGEITGTEIDQNKLIDKHYYAIASKATILKPSELVVPGDKFSEAFGESFDTVLAEGRAFNALDVCEKFSIDAAALEVIWRQSQVCKLGGGFYVGLLTFGEQPPVYVFNAFFMSMRQTFVGEGTSIHFYSIEWNSADMKWKDFRGLLIGATDPTKSHPESIRGTINAKWEELGLPRACSGSENGVHASASPLEGLGEKMNWLRKIAADEPFGSALLRHGLTEEQIAEWCCDCRVKLDADGNEGGIFDALEDIDAGECIAKCAAILAVNV